MNVWVLTRVDLRFNQLGVAGARRIARALAPNLTLTRLNLYQNHVRDDGCAAIAGALRSNTALEWLDLGHNEFGDAACVELSTMLHRHNATLTHLDIRLNPVTQGGEHMLIRALKKNAFLKKLYWGKDGQVLEMRIKVGWPRMAVK